MTSLTQDPEAEKGLIAAAQAGDERAFRSLIEPYRQAIHVHCYRMLGSLDDAEDVVQETVLRAWRALNRFEARSAVGTWLYRIATNACLDELERRPRRPEPLVDPYPDELLGEAEVPVADPAARYAVREGVELAFLTAIQRLPGRQRAVLILRDVLGWTAEETADLLDSTVAATNSALQRARATIEDVVPARSTNVHRDNERELLRRYVDAWERADMDSLVALLREDATMTMPPQPSLFGARAIADFLEHAIAGPDPRHATPTWANGQPAVLISHRASEGLGPHRLLVLDVAGAEVTGIAAHADPAILAAFDDQ